MHNQVNPFLIQTEELNIISNVHNSVRFHMSSLISGSQQAIQKYMLFKWSTNFKI